MVNTEMIEGDTKVILTTKDSMTVDLDPILGQGLPPIPEMETGVEGMETGAEGISQDQIPEMADNKTSTGKDHLQGTETVTDKGHSPLHSMASELPQNLHIGVQYLITEAGIGVKKIQLIKSGAGPRLRRESIIERRDGEITEMETGEKVNKTGMTKINQESKIYIDK